MGLLPSSVFINDAMTPLFWYSATRFSKKLVLPSKLIISIPEEINKYIKENIVFQVREGEA
jgi:hypothetical protein